MNRDEYECATGGKCKAVNKADCDHACIARVQSAAPAPVAQPVGRMSATAKRKADDLMAQGYEVAGYVLEKDGDRSAVLWDAAVRWVTPDERHRLMHVEGSLAAPAPVAQGEPVAWWIPKAEQFCIAKQDGSRPFAKAWEPLYAAPAPVAQPLTDEQIEAIFGDSPFIARRKMDKSAYEVVQQTNIDWRDCIGTEDDFKHHGEFATESEARVARQRLHVRWLLEATSQEGGA